METLSNGFVYYKIRELDGNSEKIYYERIDSTTGILYRNENQFDAEIVNLNMKYGETFHSNTGLTIAFSSTKRVLFQKIVYDVKNYVSTCCEYGGFSLVKNIGPLFQSKLIVDLPEVYDTLVGGIINGVIYGDTTKVGVDDNNGIPIVYALSQNYPNPFNPTTTINYSIPSNNKSEMANVKIVVFDILGREVATLVNQMQNPGNYEINFDASSLTSGVYLYRLTSGSFNKSMKMILMK